MEAAALTGGVHCIERGAEEEKLWAGRGRVVDYQIVSAATV